MKKILFVASIEGHFRSFHMPYLELLSKAGCEVHTAALGENEIAAVDAHHSIYIPRSPYSPRVIAAYRQLRALIERERYDVIHCHTPTASILTRLAARNARKRGTLVLYTAHGFHFYRGAPPQAMLYRAAERLMAGLTDCIITINGEDFRAARRFGCPRVERSAGMGVDPKRFSPVYEPRKNALRKLYGIPQNAFVIIYPAEFCTRKNHAMLLRAAKMLQEKIPNLFLLLPGDGALREKMRDRICAMGMEENAWLPGHRRDMPALMQLSDVDAAPSKQEGQGLHLAEALCCGVPCVCTAIRGHTECVTDGYNGYLIPPGDAKQMAVRLYTLYSDRALRGVMSANALASSEKFHIEATLCAFRRLYEELGILNKEGQGDAKGFCYNGCV